MQPTVEQTVIAVLQLSLILDDRPITLDCLLANLNADSLALLDMVLMLGEVFEIDIQTEHLVGIHSVADLCQMVHSRL